MTWRRLARYGAALAAMLVGPLMPRAVPAQAPIRLVTFNIRYGTANDGEHSWPDRRAAVIGTIADHAPHLLGVQEALRFQLDEIGVALPRYREVGVGRDDGRTAGEYSAILVDTARFTILGSGTFWYSDTPEASGTVSWGNRITRIATWVRVADRATGETILVYNTHWDHESQPSRVRSAKLLLHRIRRERLRSEAVLVLGDFNSGEENPAFQSLLSDDSVGIRDTYTSTHPGERPMGTYHAFRGDSSGAKIDAILASRELVVRDAGIDSQQHGGIWASDHFAVWAVVSRMK